MLAYHVISWWKTRILKKNKNLLLSVVHLTFYLSEVWHCHQQTTQIYKFKGYVRAEVTLDMLISGFSWGLFVLECDPVFIQNTEGMSASFNVIFYRFHLCSTSQNISDSGTGRFKWFGVCCVYNIVLLIDSMSCYEMNFKKSIFTFHLEYDGLFTVPELQN